MGVYCCEDGLACMHTGMVRYICIVAIRMYVWMCVVVSAAGYCCAELLF